MSGALDDPARGFRERQQHDQHVGLRKHALQALPRRRSKRFREAPFRFKLHPATLKPSAFSFAAASLPMHAQSEHADLDIAGLGLPVVVLPQALALLAFVAAQLPQVNERVHRRPTRSCGR